MYILYALFRVFPYWGLPLALVIGEVGMHFRRRGRKERFLFFGMTAFLLVLIVVWFAGRGDLHSDAWVRSFLS